MDDPTIPVYARWLGSWQISLRRRPHALSELAAHYDRAAPEWGRLIERLGYPDAYRQLFQDFLSSAELAPGERALRVLDCGVGTGALARAFADAWAADIDLHAVDVSAAMLEHAKRHLADAQIAVTTRQASVCSLPYADGEFDLVIAAHVLEHLPNPVAALVEMQRVLAPGGWLVACLTRASLLGRYIQVKWRTHRLTPERATRWLADAGLEPHPLEHLPDGYFARASLSCVGRKS